jgi:branched-chain amino acid transport system permease protein
MNWLNIILQGVLVGGLYAMFAAGLALIFGVMRLVNIAHGDLIVLAAYLALVVTETLGLHPLPALIVVVPLMALIGYFLQRGILNRTVGDDLLPPLLVTFGLSITFRTACWNCSLPIAGAYRQVPSRSPAFSSAAGSPSASCR